MKNWKIVWVKNCEQFLACEKLNFIQVWSKCSSWLPVRVVKYSLNKSATFSSTVAPTWLRSEICLLYSFTGYFVDVSEDIIFCWNGTQDLINIKLAFLINHFSDIFELLSEFWKFYWLLKKNIFFTIARWTSLSNQGTFFLRETIVFIVM